MLRFSNQNVSSPGITFVPEFSTYSKNFEEDESEVVAIDVSSCHLLEICNIASGNRTAFSLTHLTMRQLDGKHPEILLEGLGKVLKEFEAVGGDIPTAIVRVYGGTNNEHLRNSHRLNLINALEELGVNQTRMVPRFHMTKPKHTYEIMFSKAGMSFLRADMEFADGSKDAFKSKEFSYSQFRSKIDRAFFPISRQIDSLTKSRMLTGFRGIVSIGKNSSPLPDSDTVKNLASNKNRM